MRKALLAVGLSVILASCTTTKDLEMHPELVAVATPKVDEKESAKHPSAENGSPTSKKESTTPSASVSEAAAPEDAGKPSADVEGKSNGSVPCAPAPAQAGPSAPPVVVEKKVYVEKPIYYPENAASAEGKPCEPVASAVSQGVMKPKDYNGAIMFYDYDQILVYQVFAMPLRVTDIYLAPGEKVIEQPFCGDTTRWNIGGGVSKTAGLDTQHLYLKPSEEGLETTLIVNTDRRIYHLIIKSFKDTFMLAVMWRYPGCPGTYPSTDMPHDFLSSEDRKNEGGSASKQNVDQSEDSVSFSVNPALISSDYTVSYPKSNLPQWLPIMVIDDGAKTYIVLPDTVIHHELPAVFGDNGEIVNFRVKDNLVVIDRLIRKMQLKLRDVTVEIKKKGPEVSNQELDSSERKASSAGTTAKASPEAVIGKRSQTGRLNKRLILGIITAAVVGMLVLNFLPNGKKRKGGDDSGAVYANDAMPQDVREMASKLPEVKVAPASSTPVPGYRRDQAVTDPFAGYPSTSGPSTRSTSTAEAHAAGKDYEGMASADARLEAEKAARRAPMEVATKLTAGLTVASLAQSSNANATATTLGAPAGSSSTESWGAAQETPYVVSGVMPQVAYTPGEVYRDLNDQKTKAEFSAQKAEAVAASVARPVDPSLVPYTIFAGTIIPAALQTSINTDLPGDVLATVSENVYDSVSGKNLLIPQGSKLLAKYSSNISFGQNRVQVAWQRLIRPDGVNLQLANMNGVDPQGMSGYTGHVDQHWWEYAKGIGLMMLFSIIDGQLQYSMKEANTQGAGDVANSLTAGIDQVGSQYTANAMNIQPTIIVKQGAKVQVFVNADMIMPPANQKEVLKKYSIPKKEGGTQ